MSRWSDAAKRALVRPKTKDGTKYQYDSIFHYFTLWYIIDTLVPNIEICIKPCRNSEQILLDSYQSHYSRGVRIATHPDL